MVFWGGIRTQIPIPMSRQMVLADATLISQMDILLMGLTVSSQDQCRQPRVLKLGVSQKSENGYDLNYTKSAKVNCCRRKRLSFPIHIITADRPRQREFMLVFHIE
jgi:hypothetical protein